MKRAQAFTILAAAFLWLSSAAPSAAGANNGAQQLDRLFSRSTLQIATSDAKLHKINIWVADNDARRMRGLMFVEDLADDAGMLFVYPQSQEVGIWMKNTPLSLDILFVNADGRVHRVFENAKPQSLDTIPSDGPVLAVIELKAGSAARLNIRPGAQVIHPAFRLN
ncbi:MAG TPA: DUF192 domain-containing protein [Steroidobacteraceae bacterium]|jgi:uncharacterized membrane protein (UPF0127 family)|nr:DUF192 domain-containing protein [Steroidobacteraceae bacterium]